MENVEYANAYREVIEILKYISIEDYNKIPEDKILLFESNANTDYKFKYNPNLTLDEQKVSKRAKAIIAILFRDYWATPEQKEKIITKQNYDRLENEKEKQKKYKTDNIFRNNPKNIDTTKEQENVALIKYVEPKWYQKIFKKIKNLFK